MSCNCSTAIQIDELHRVYGYKVKESRDKSAIYRFKEKIINFEAGLETILMIPFLFLYVGYKGFFGDGKISMSKFFKLK